MFNLPDKERQNIKLIVPADQIQVDLEERQRIERNNMILETTVQLRSLNLSNVENLPNAMQTIDLKTHKVERYRQALLAEQKEEKDRAELRQRLESIKNKAQKFDPTKPIKIGDKEYPPILVSTPTGTDDELFRADIANVYKASDPVLAPKLQAIKVSILPEEMHNINYPNLPWSARRALSQVSLGREISPPLDPPVQNKSLVQKLLNIFTQK